jgi:hypothetical protein
MTRSRRHLLSWWSWLTKQNLSVNRYAREGYRRPITIILAWSDQRGSKKKKTMLCLRAAHVQYGRKFYSIYLGSANCMGMSCEINWSCVLLRCKQRKIFSTPLHSGYGKHKCGKGRHVRVPNCSEHVLRTQVLNCEFRAKWVIFFPFLFLWY